MSTVAQVIDKTIRQHLEPAGTAQLNRLQAGINSSVEQLNLDWQPEPDIAPGAFIEVGSEVMLVVAAQDTIIDVLRAQMGSIAATHATGDLVHVSPRFLRTQVLTEMQDEIRSWPRSLFGVSVKDVSWSSGSYDVDLGSPAGTQVIRLLAARVKSDGSDPWWDIKTAISVSPAETADFASGWRLHTLRSFSGDVVQVTYAHEFLVTTLDESTDLITTVGLSPAMEDIIRFGTASRLLVSQESERSRLDQQGGTRFAEEVPPEAQLTASQALGVWRDKRIQDEEDRLLSRWGVM